jgi:chromosome segregation ATPase
LSSDRDWYRDQYDALDALVEALRTNNGWLEYPLQIVRDELLDQGAQTAEDTSAVEKVRVALLERDEALRKAREDLATVRAVATEFETELASARAQLQQDRATLEGGGPGRARPRRKPRRLSS